MKLYLSGPMTGIQDFNFPKFNYVAKKIRENHTYEVLNPAEWFNGRQDLPRRAYMRMDIRNMLEADGIVMMDDWQHSQGAKLEFAIAKELDLEIFRWDEEKEKLFVYTADIKYELE